MKVAVGTDIIEINRVKNSIDRSGNSFLEKIYTQKEIEYCKSHKENMYQHFAARFAAKEAGFKAITKICDKNILKWHDFEVVNEKNGRPKLIVKNCENFKDIDVTLSHCKDYAIATVIILYE